MHWPWPWYPGICPMAMIDGLKKLSMVTETLEFTSWSMVNGHNGNFGHEKFGSTPRWKKSSSNIVVKWLKILTMDQFWINAGVIKGYHLSLSYCGEMVKKFWPWPLSKSTFWQWTMTIVKIEISRGQNGQPEIWVRNWTQNVHSDHWPWGKVLCLSPPPPPPLNLIIQWHGINQIDN